MRSYGPWKRIQDNRIVKWDTPGTVFEGLWHGTVASKFTDDEGRPQLNGILKTDAGEVCFKMTSNLTRKLEQVSTGAPVRIAYVGPPLPGAREKRFDADVADTEAGEGPVDVAETPDERP